MATSHCTKGAILAYAHCGALSLSEAPKREAVNERCLPPPCTHFWLAPSAHTARAPLRLKVRLVAQDPILDQVPPSLLLSLQRPLQTYLSPPFASTKAKQAVLTFAAGFWCFVATPLRSAFLTLTDCSLAAFILAQTSHQENPIFAATHLLSANQRRESRFK
ncbi:hypothetical protein VTH82DRAFT_7485 [Thermothelomyces myriococcoides]